MHNLSPPTRTSERFLLFWILQIGECFHLLSSRVFHLFDVFPSNDLTCFPANDWFSIILTFFRQMTRFPVSIQYDLGNWKSSQLTEKRQNDGKPVKKWKTSRLPENRSLTWEQMEALIVSQCGGREREYSMLISVQYSSLVEC